MSPMLRICTSCSQMVKGDCECAGAQAARRRADQHRLARRRSSGRNTQAWQRLRAQALVVQPYCADCGKDKRMRPDLRLTVHHETYPAVTLEDVTVLCDSCHGARDGAKARAC